jgi:hypothetical protein
MLRGGASRPLAPIMLRRACIQNICQLEFFAADEKEFFFVPVAQNKKPALTSRNSASTSNPLHANG